MSGVSGSSHHAKPVLISGAGISALLLAQSLALNKIPFQIFERDESISFRAQGYRLRLSEAGLDAIESVLSPEHWQRFWDTCGKTGGNPGVDVVDAVSGEDIPSQQPDKPKADAVKEAEGSSNRGGGPEMLASRGGKTVGIARGDMRRLFMSGIEDQIQWGRKVTGYELTDSGVRCIFGDGSKSTEGSLLIGGEGIYSKIAQQLSEGKLKTYDTGARGIHGQAPTTAFKGLGEGVWRLVDDRRDNGKVFVITNVRAGDMDDPSINFGWTLGGQPGVVKAPNDDYTIVGKEAAKIAQSLTQDWHPRLKPLFDQMNVDEAAFWKITCSTPTGIPDWTNSPRVTLIGDAVHSMTPAGGNGANTAVRDSALLGRLIKEAGGFKEGLTAEYEEKMKEYASEQVRMSYNSASKQFGIKIDENSPVVT